MGGSPSPCKIPPRGSSPIVRIQGGGCRLPMVSRFETADSDTLISELRRRMARWPGLVPYLWDRSRDAAGRVSLADSATGWLNSPNDVTIISVLSRVIRNDCSPSQPNGDPLSVTQSYACRTSRCRGCRELCVCGWEMGGFSIFDVSDPSNPHIVGSIADDVDNAQTTLPLNENVLLLGKNDLLTIDVTGSLKPTVLDRLRDP